MRALVLTLGAVFVTGLMAGCTLDGHCYQSSAKWTEPTLFNVIGSAAADETSAESGLPASNTWIQDRWPDATIESITWLPIAIGDHFQEPGNGLDFRAEPMIQLFASREEYGIRPGWPHSYPYGPRIDIPAEPFLVVVVTEPHTPGHLVDEITDFLSRLGVAPEAHQDIVAHLQAHKEKHTGARNPSTGEETWKYGHWAPIADLPQVDHFIATLQGEARLESRFVGWTDLVFDPQTKITLDQPTRQLEIQSSIGSIAIDVDGSGFVHATSPEQYVGDETDFRRALEDGFQNVRLPLTGLGQAKIERTIDC